MHINWVYDNIGDNDGDTLFGWFIWCVWWWTVNNNQFSLHLTWIANGIIGYNKFPVHFEFYLLAHWGLRCVYLPKDSFTRIYSRTSHLFAVNMNSTHIHKIYNVYIYIIWMCVWPLQLLHLIKMWIRSYTAERQTSRDWRTVSSVQADMGPIETAAPTLWSALIWL